MHPSMLAGLMLGLLGLMGIWIVNGVHGAEYDYRSSVARIQTGKSELEKIETYVMRSRIPRHGSCWKDALQSLENACRDLDEATQTKLALAFTSCFGEMLGQAPIICEPSNNPKECARALDAEGRENFRHFFLHTQDMCYYIQTELWQEETDRTVNSLHKAAVDMEKTVGEQKVVAQSILQTQQEAQKVQGDMLKENNLMYDTLIKIKDVFQDFSQVTMEHRAIFYEIFDKLQRMQELVTWIQGEMSLIDVIGFYLVALVFAYFATATERTHRARLWVILTLACSLFAERQLYNWMSDSAYNYSPDYILEWISLMRRLFALLGVIQVLFASAMYKDMQQINNSLLFELKAQVDNVMGILQNSQIGDLENRLAILGDTLDQEYVPGAELEREESSGSDSDLTSDMSSDEKEFINSSANRDESKENVPKPKQAGNQGLLGKLFKRNSSSTGASSSSRESPSPSTSRYNLRDRNRSSTPNPLVQRESPQQFVESLQASRISFRRSPVYYSSDDE